MVDNLTHSPKCGNTTFRLRWDGFTPNKTYPGLLVCDECDWSTSIELGMRRCEQCKAPMRHHHRLEARYCSDACRQAAYRSRKA